MAEHIIRKGLDLPISGRPASEIHPAQTVSHVGLLGHDYPGMKPRMHVQVGDRVKRGQRLFSDRKSEGVHFTAPAAGEVVAIHRGERRAFQSLVIRMSEGERAGAPGPDEMAPIEARCGRAADLSGPELRALLTETGQWTALRTRPYDQVPEPDGQAAAIFVTAIDTNPLAGSPELAVLGHEEAFAEGLRALTKLTDGPTYLCTDRAWAVELPQIGRAHV